jgi:hypothetical protein
VGATSPPYPTSEEVPITHSTRLAARIAYLAFAVPASALALSSYCAYTTAGFDFEVPRGRGVAVHYYRLRWDDGSTWVGWAVQPVRRPRRPLNWFDPGGTVLAPLTRPAHRTWASALGFWWIDGASTDPYVTARYPRATASRWWAVPSWLVLLGLWHRALCRSVGRFVRRSPRPPSSPNGA